MSDQPTGEPTYEAARDELIEVVRRLEAGGTPLAESMQLWERGEQLAETCQRWLDGARQRIDAARRPDPAPGHPDQGEEPAER